MDFPKLLIEQNDRKIKKSEDTLKKEIDRIYEKAVAAAIKEFRALEKADPNAKADSEEVQKIIGKVEKAFRKEFIKLVESIQKETLECYDDGVEETALLIAVGETK